MTQEQGVAKALSVIQANFGPVTWHRLLVVYGDRLAIAAQTENLDTPLVLKAALDTSTLVEGELFRVAASHGIPVPEVLASGRSWGLPGGQWLITGYADGVAWRPDDQTEAMRRATYADLASFFHRLHMIGGKGYGIIGPDLVGMSSSWKLWLCSEGRKSLRNIYSAGLCTYDRYRFYLMSLEQIVSKLPDVEPALLHGDLGDSEIFVEPETGRLTAILDWGGSIYGDPLYDFSRFLAGGAPGDTRRSQHFEPVFSQYLEETSLSTQYLFSARCAAYDFHNCIRNASWAAVHAPHWFPAIDYEIARSVEVYRAILGE